jgi:lysophospholipase L1-like esterase
MATETLTTTTTAVAKAGERVLFPYPSGQPAGAYQSSGAVLRVGGVVLPIGFGVSFDSAGAIVTPAASCEIPAGTLTLAVNYAAVIEPAEFTSAPAIYNLKPSNLKKWRKALGNVRTGTANARVLCVGDSTTRGLGGAASNANIAQKCYPAYLADILSGQVTTGKQSFFGSGNLVLPTIDTRVVITGGTTTATNLTLGGSMVQLTASGHTLTFTPTTNIDTIDVYYSKTGTTASFTVNVDGGAALATVNTNGTAGVYKQTVTTTLGAHAINCVWAQGTNYILGIEAYDSTRKQVSIWNMGASGARSTDLADTSAGYAELNALLAYAPDLTILDCGINDMNNGVTVDAHRTNMQAVITAAKTSGDVIIKVPAPSSVAAIPQATQDTFAAAMYALAEVNDLPVIDLRQRLASYEDANAMGLYYDTLHPNALGYADIAQVVAKALMV